MALDEKMSVVIDLKDELSGGLTRIRGELGKFGNDLTGGKIKAVSFGTALHNLGGVAMRALGTVGQWAGQALAAIERLGAVGVGVLAGVAAGLFAATQKAASFGSKLWDMHLRSGASVETLSALKYAAEQAGASLDAVGTGLRFVARTSYEARDATSEQAAAYAALGVSLTDAQGKWKGTADLFVDVGEALRNVADENMQTALAVEIFGRAGQALVPMFVDPVKSIREYMMEARNLGLLLSGPAAAQADDFGDAMDRLKAKLTMAVVQVGLAAMPAFQGLVDALVGAGPALTEFITKNTQGILDFATFFADAGMQITESALQLMAWFTANQAVIGEWFKYLVDWAKYAVDWVKANLPDIALTIIDVVTRTGEGILLLADLINSVKTGFLVVGETLGAIFVSAFTIIGTELKVSAELFKFWAHVVAAAVEIATLGAVKMDLRTVDWAAKLASDIGSDTYEATAEAWGNVAKTLTEGRENDLAISALSGKLQGYRASTQQWAGGLPRGIEPTAPTAPTGRFVPWGQATGTVKVEVTGTNIEGDKLARDPEFRDACWRAFAELAEKWRYAPAQ